MTALLLRLLLYPIGFGVSLLLSKSMSDVDFGVYSAITSLLELALIAAICGASFSLTRWSATTKRRPTGRHLISILAIGTPIATAAITVANCFIQQFNTWTTLLLLMNLIVQSLSLLQLAVLRGLGNVKSQVIEPLTRYIIYLPFVTLAYLTSSILTPASSLLILLLANTVALIYTTLTAQQYPSALGSKTPLSTLINPWSAAFSALQFCLRKSDVLLVLWMTGPSMAGSMKLAFPILEIPIQFYLLSVSKRASGIIEQGAKNGFRSAFIREATSALPYSLLVVAAIPAIRTGQELSLWSAQVFVCAIAIAPLMIIRLLTSSFEQTLTLLGKYRAANAVAIIEILTKGLAIVASTTLTNNIQIIYICLATCEAAVYLAAAIWASKNISKEMQC